MADQALVVTDSVDRNAFLGYLEHSLLPTLAAGSVLVMDNWTVHHGDEVRDLVNAYDCELLYLPTYSPDRFRQVILKGARPSDNSCTSSSAARYC